MNESMCYIQVYTSGYKSENSVGSGFCVFNGSLVIKRGKYKLSHHCSRFQSELYSVLTALSFMKIHRNNQNFTIYCNPTVINALKNTYSTTELV